MLSFGMLLMPTMYRSYSNYQMTSGCLWGSMNLHMNQCWSDMSARQNLYNVPIMNFSNFSPYGVFSSMNYLLDPGYTASQYISMQMASQGGFANMQMPTMPSTDGLTGGSTLSDEEKAAKKAYNKLKLLLETCLKNVGRGITDNDKDFVQEALKKSGKWSDRLDALKEAYKKFDENVIKKSMTQIQSKDKKVDYTTLLKDIGYNFDNDNSYKSDCNNELKEELQTIVNDNDYDALKELVEGLEDENNVLNLISTWNDIDGQQNLIDYLIDNTANGDKIPELTEALIDKAESIKVDARLLQTSEDYIQDLIDELNQEKSRIYDTNGPAAPNGPDYSLLKELFNDLYMALRLAEIKMAQEKMRTEYGFIADISNSDSDFIKDQNLLIDETMKDLKENEHFIESELTDHANNIKLTA